MSDTPLIKTGARPQKFSYRPNCPPIWNQGKRGTCTAHGVTRVICSRFLGAGQEPVGDLSREFAFWAAKQLDGMKQQDGSTSWAAFQGFVKYGCPPDSLDPYRQDENDLALAPPSAAALAAAPRWKIPGFVQLLNAGDPSRGDNTIETLLNALWQYGPLAIAHMVASNFQPDAAKHIVPLPEGSVEGGHEECIVGWDEDQRVFEVANSWSEDWGDKGYSYFPFEWFTSSYDPIGDGSKAYYVYDSYTTTMQPVPRTADKMVLTIGSRTALVDGQQVEMDQAPETDPTTNRSLIPDRFCAGNMGYAVGWDPVKQQITFTRAVK